MKNPRPPRIPIRRIAVIGAGVSGLVSARTLQDQEFSVTVFEKSHGPGGRTATRRADPGLSFDHGAQYFTARETHFKAFVEEGVRQGIVAEWTGLIVQIDGKKVESKTEHPVRYVGVPAMTAIATHLADELTIHRETRIVELTRVENGWELTDTNGHTYRDYDYVIVSLPAPQTTLLLGDHVLAQDHVIVVRDPVAMEDFEYLVSRRRREVGRHHPLAVAGLGHRSNPVNAVQLAEMPDQAVLQFLVGGDPQPQQLSTPVSVAARVMVGGKLLRQSA